MRIIGRWLWKAGAERGSTAASLRNPRLARRAGQARAGLSANFCSVRSPDPTLAASIWAFYFAPGASNPRSRRPGAWA
jgi:hypothetical protein